MYKLILFLLLPTLANADIVSDRCFSIEPTIYNYDNSNRGLVSIYTLPEEYVFSPTELHCIVGHIFLNSVNDFPTKRVIGLLSADYTRLQLIQWDLSKQTLLLINIDLTIQSDKNGIFTFYPEPLKRLKEIIINKSFPSKDQIPIEYVNKFKINFITAKKTDIQKLVNNF